MKAEIQNVRGLKKEGYNTIEAADGVTAVDGSTRTKARFNIIRYNASKMDGLAVCKRIRHT